MRQLAIVTLVLATLLSLTNAFALQGASVSTPAVVSVVSTDTAVIGIRPGPETNTNGTLTGNAAGTAYLGTPSTSLVLDFRKGRGGGTTFGFQTAPAGYSNIYTQKKLFYVDNNSDEEQCLSVYVPGATATIGPAELKQISIGGTNVAGARGARATCVQVLPGASVAVDFHWTISSTTDLLNQSFSITVEGKKCSGGPC